MRTNLSHSSPVRTNLSAFAATVRDITDRDITDRDITDRDITDRGITDRGIADRGIASRGIALALVLAAGSASMVAPRAHAGGTPENAIILIDPSSAESMFVGNYYKNARNIPDSNVLYMDPDAANFTNFVAQNMPGLQGYLTNAALGDHIDYIIVTPGNSFFVSAPGILSDSCSPVNRFSITTAYTTSFITADFLPPIATQNSQFLSRYYNPSNFNAQFFDSNVTYSSGLPSTASNARRYYISSMLGYIGTFGNTVPEILAMIDRSVAADGTRPTGTFYFENNTADPARNVRSGQYAGAVNNLISQGYLAVKQDGVELPIGKNDILGIMSGFAGANVDAASMTIKPGAFCDHLTSWAAMFDNGAQTKVSSWIRRGASGSAGEVEEPCNYTGKFPNARFHNFYGQGASLGEAYLRSCQYVPFQGLLYGDPLTRPFAHLPAVSVTGIPTGTASGSFIISPSATTARPSTAIASFDLHIDGKFIATALVGQTFTVDTTTLPDGHHDLRVIAYDNTANKAANRFVGSFVSSNFGRSASLGIGSVGARLSDPSMFNLTASGVGVKELRVLLNGRVVGTRSNNGPVSIYGHNLGAGTLSVQAEALYLDGRISRSAPATLNLAFDVGSPSGTLPAAFSYTKVIRTGAAAVVELPANFDSDPSTAVYTIVSGPSQATVLGGGTNAYRIISPTAGAAGCDTITFRVQTPSGTSNTATVNLIYNALCRADFNGDCFVTGEDFDAYVNAFIAGDLAADFDGDGFVTGDDFDAFVLRFESGC